MIDITILGTAALMPLPARALTAVTVTCGGHSILFDCGEGTQVAARQAGVSLLKITLIAFSHYHGDHIFGLPGVLQSMESLGRTEPLYLAGPPGLEENLTPLLQAAAITAYELKFITIPPLGLPLATLTATWPHEAVLKTFATQHRVVSRGYSFELARAGKFLPEKALSLGIPREKWHLLQQGATVEVAGTLISPAAVLGPPRQGLKVVFTGDTAFSEALATAAAGADILISEATYGEESQTERALEHGHMTFSQAALVAQKAAVKSLYLVHYSPMIDHPETYLPAAQAIFANTLCGRDGLKIALQFQ